MLNPNLVRHAKALTQEIAELREMGFADDDLDRATETLAYCTLSRMADSRLPRDGDERIPTDQIAEPADE